MTKSDVATLLRCCERTVERQVKLRAFPPPQRFGKESLWFQSIVFSWLEKRREAQQNWVEQVHLVDTSVDMAMPVPVPQPTAISAAPALEPTKKPGRPRKERIAAAAFRSAFTAEELSSIGRPLTVD